MQNDKLFHYAIEGSMTSARVAELREIILVGIAKVKKTEIDLSQVTEIDHAGVRLMMEAKLAASLSNGEMWFTGHSRVVVARLEQYGMSDFFDVSAGTCTKLH
jgi:anti-anti-sigma regulatory factor